MGEGQEARWVPLWYLTSNILVGSLLLLSLLSLLVPGQSEGVGRARGRLSQIFPSHHPLGTMPQNTVSGFLQHLSAPWSSIPQQFLLHTRPHQFPPVLWDLVALAGPLAVLASPQARAFGSLSPASVDSEVFGK